MAHRQVTSFTAAEAIEMMDAAGVDAAIIHPPPWDPGAHELALKAVQNYPGRFAIMGSLPFDAPKTRNRIAGWRNQSRVLGPRYLFLGEPARVRLCNGSMDWLWAETERAGVPVPVLATDALREIGVIADHHPGLQLTIDHLGGRGGNTTLKDAAAMTHMPELLKLAKHSNVTVVSPGA